MNMIRWPRTSVKFLCVTGDSRSLSVLSVGYRNVAFQSFRGDRTVVDARRFSRIQNASILLSIGINYSRVELTAWKYFKQLFFKDAYCFLNKAPLCFTRMYSVPACMLALPCRLILWFNTRFLTSTFPRWQLVKPREWFNRFFLLFFLKLEIIQSVRGRRIGMDTEVSRSTAQTNQREFSLTRVAHCFSFFV